MPWLISGFTVYIGFKGTDLFNGKSRSRVNSSLYYGTYLFKHA